MLNRLTQYGGAFVCFRKSMASRKLDFGKDRHSVDATMQEHSKKSTAATSCKLNSSDAPEDEVYVGNICYEYNESKLLEIFKDYQVQDVRIKRNVKNQITYAFLKLKNNKEAHRVVKEMMGARVDGRRLLVRMAMTPQKTFPSSDSDGGPPDLEHIDEYEGLPPLEPINNKNDYSGMPSLEPIDYYSKMPPLEPIDDYSNLLPLEPIEKNTSNSFVDRHSASVCSVGTDKIPPVPDPLGQVILGNFPYGSSEADLMNIFNKFQPVMCRIYINAPTSRISKPTYAFVYLLNSHFATAAEKALHQTNYKGNVITVKNVSNLPNVVAT